jgi:chemosensory pili system protein ChpC
MTDILSCLLLSLEDKNLILPSSAIAEIMPYENPRILPDMPNWIIGILTWRDIQVPLADLEKMEDRIAWQDTSIVEPQKTPDHRIAILNRIYKMPKKELNENSKYPFFAIVLKHNPKFYRISSEEMGLVKEFPAEERRFLMEVKVRTEPAFIPNLRQLWEMIDTLPSRLQLFRQTVV